MYEFLGIIVMALIMTLTILGGFYFGFKLVDICTGGELSRILGGR